jgi:hypothetical protein
MMASFFSSRLSNISDPVPNVQMFHSPNNRNRAPPPNQTPFSVKANKHSVVQHNHVHIRIFSCIMSEISATLAVRPRILSASGFDEKNSISARIVFSNGCAVNLPSNHEALSCASAHSPTTQHHRHQSICTTAKTAQTQSSLSGHAISWFNSQPRNVTYESTTRETQSKCVVGGPLQQQRCRPSHLEHSTVPNGHRSCHWLRTSAYFRASSQCSSSLFQAPDQVQAIGINRLSVRLLAVASRTSDSARERERESA